MKTLLALFFMTLAPLAAQETKGVNPMVPLTVIGKVAYVNLTNREITIVTPLGQAATLTVDKKVKDLKDYKTSDPVKADLFIGVAAEIREPSPTEKIVPFVVVEQKQEAAPGADPTSVKLRTIRVLATVEALDRPSQTVTVKGPQGNFLTVRVKSAEVVEKLRIGLSVVMTCTEGLVTNLEKQKPEKK